MKKTFDFDFDKGDFNLKNGSPAVLTGIDALKLWIQKAINTQFGRYSIYKGRQYGANIEDLIIGKSSDPDFVKSELRREIEATLLRHDDITGMISFDVTRESSVMRISFTLTTAYGTVGEVYTYDG
ncbi:MAG: DUF2634 domain-containing protein [Oscillospiraceae bacterium]|nr:DUF2634 domain-containing protein [Oscillospiraceae bacterium]